MKKKKIIIVSLFLAIFSLVLVISGVTYALITYRANGVVTSTISTGSIKLHYTELSKKGKGISITDSLPVASNETAKTGNKYFDFKITGAANNRMQVAYIVTARMDKNSDAVMGEIVDVYLTELGDNETPTELFSGNIVKYNDLDQYVEQTNYTEKIIYTDTVTGSDYEKNFRLRMWIDQYADYSKQCSINLSTNNTEELCDSVGGVWDYRYNNKTFSITVNVNAVGNLTRAISNSPIGDINSPTIVSLDSGPDTDIVDPNNVDDPNNCQSQGRYELKCSCDDRTLEWEANKYFDQNGYAMDATRKTEANYPPKYTYGCTCGSQTGYVKNTGKMLGRVCNNTQGNRLNAVVLADNEVKASPVNLTSTSSDPMITSYTDDNFTGPESSRDVIANQQYYKYAASYTFDPITKTYSFVNPQVCYYSDCYETLRGKYVTSVSGGTNESVASSINTDNINYDIYKLTDNCTADKIYYIEATQTPNYTNNSGLFKKDDIYYFRGIVENNYVDFAGFTWRIVRINEDGTIRLIMDSRIITSDDGNGHKTYFESKFNPEGGTYKNMYYTESELKTAVEDWYRNNIGNNSNYYTKVARGNYFCEASRVKEHSGILVLSTGRVNATVIQDYTPTFECITDDNGYGFVDSKVGLLTLDEALFAGGGYHVTNEDFYLYKSGTNENNHHNSYDLFTMTPNGWYTTGDYAGNFREAQVWAVGSVGNVKAAWATSNNPVRPVINLKSNVTMTKDPTTGHYVVN